MLKLHHDRCARASGVTENSTSILKTLISLRACMGYLCLCIGPSEKVTEEMCLYHRVRELAARASLHVLPGSDCTRLVKTAEEVVDEEFGSGQ